jgi:hypothetical protein
MGISVSKGRSGEIFPKTAQAQTEIHIYVLSDQNIISSHIKLCDIKPVIRLVVLSESLHGLHNR